MIRMDVLERLHAIENKLHAVDVSEHYPPNPPKYLLPKSMHRTYQNRDLPDEWPCCGANFQDDKYFTGCKKTCVDCSMGNK